MILSLRVRIQLPLAPGKNGGKKQIVPLPMSLIMRIGILSQFKMAMLDRSEQLSQDVRSILFPKSRTNDK
jgi:hypothetical protein